MSIGLLWISLLLLALAGGCEGYASYMVQSAYCSRSLTAGTKIMGIAAVSSSTRTVSITRNGVPLSAGSSYVYGETLVVSLSATSGQYVIQVTGGAKISGGGCSSTRKADSSATITMPTSGSATITILAAWATSQSTVRITPSVLLTAPSSSSTTTSSTVVPTMSPTVASSSSNLLTPSPTTNYNYNYTGSGEYDTENETDENGNNSNSLSLTSLSKLSTSAKAGVGFLIGALSLIFLYFVAWFVASSRLNNNNKNNDTSSSFAFFTAVCTVVLTAVTVALTCLWARNNSSNTSSASFPYLGTPSWTDNIFAYHPVLLTAGFASAQLLALCTWTLFSSTSNNTSHHYVAKLTHVFFQLVSMSTLIAGIWAIWKYKLQMKSQSFTTVHSWLGIATVAVYGLTFAWGSFMAILTRFYPESVFRKAFDLKAAHRTLGLLSLFLTMATVLTGIMDHLPAGTCNTAAATANLQDAAASFSDMSTACKIANGLSMTTMIATVCAFVTVMYRGDSFGFLLNTNNNNNNSTSSKSSLNSNATAPVVARLVPYERFNITSDNEVIGYPA